MPEFNFNSTTADPNQSVKPGCYLGFDFGMKRIGIASGNTATDTATPLITVNNNHGKPDWTVIDKIIQEWQPVGLVIGRPLHIDGSTQEMTNHAKGFARQLFRRYALPVFSADERHTSREAEALIRQKRQLGQSGKMGGKMGGKTNKKDVDKIAATLLLRQWLENIVTCDVK